MARRLGPRHNGGPAVVASVVLGALGVIVGARFFRSVVVMAPGLLSYWCRRYFGILAVLSCLWYRAGVGLSWLESVSVPLSNVVSSLSVRLCGVGWLPGLPSDLASRI